MRLNHEARQSQRDILRPRSASLDSVIAVRALLPKARIVPMQLTVTARNLQQLFQVKRTLIIIFIPEHATTTMRHRETKLSTKTVVTLIRSIAV